MPTPVDVEALVAAHLREDDLPFYGGTVPPDRSPAFPVGRISAAPGGIAVTSRPLWVGRHLLYGDAWADTRDAAFDLAADAMASMEDLPGEHALGVVTAVTFTLLPAWEPDESMGDPAKARWRWAAYVTAHPSAADGT